MSGGRFVVVVWALGTVVAGCGDAADAAQRDGGLDASMRPSVHDAAPATRDADVAPPPADSGSIGGNGGTGGVGDDQPMSPVTMDMDPEQEPEPVMDAGDGDAGLDAGMDAGGGDAELDAATDAATGDAGSDASMHEDETDADTDPLPTCVPACSSNMTCASGPSGPHCVDKPCAISSGYPGDDACLLPPDPADGFQIHIGPDDYGDSSQIDTFKFGPGHESSECWSFNTPNVATATYARVRISARPGAFRMMGSLFTTENTKSGWSACRDGGTGTASDLLRTWLAFTGTNLPLHEIAPENAGISAQFAPSTPAQLELHALNTTGSTILREVWINVYYDKAGHSGAPQLVRAMGGLGWNISPIALSTDHVYAFSCPISADARLLWLQSTMHSHTVRQSAWIKHAGGTREQIFELYDWTAQRPFYYDSVTTNPGFSSSAAGAWSGPLELHAGDTLQWECRINNDDTPGGLRYTNEVNTGEMCNLFGETVGPAVACTVF